MIRDYTYYISRYILIIIIHDTFVPSSYSVVSTNYFVVISIEMMINISLIKFAFFIKLGKHIGMLILHNILLNLFL